MSSSSLAAVVFGDFLLASIAICVFVLGCVFMLKRCRKDQQIIRDLTMRVVPAELVTGNLPENVQVVGVTELPHVEEHI